MAEKDELVSQSMEQKDPYRAKGSDFPVKAVSARHGQSGSKGTASGEGELAKAPVGPRNLEDDGDMTPSVWGKGGKAFTIERNQGESGSSPSGVSISESVNLEDGSIDVKGYGSTRVKEVGESKVRIAR